MSTLSAGHRSPLHLWHVAHGARFAESDGWLVPLSYTDPRQEVEAARNGIGLADICPFAKLSLRGPRVSAVAAALGNPGPRRVSTFDGGIACRLSEQCLFLLASSTSKAGLAAALPLVPKPVATDITSAYAGFAMLGEHGETLLQRLTAFDVSRRQFPEGACAESELAGVHVLLVRPPARIVPETLLYIGWDLAEYVWSQLLHAGRDMGLVPLGLDSLAMLRNQ